MLRIAFGALAALAIARHDAGAQRQRLSMDPGWRFTLGDVAGAEQPAFTDAAWRTLDLPHDWSIEGPVKQDAPAGGGGGYFPTGVGWYRKAFRLPAGAAGRVAWLEFDGVYMNADVWVNGVKLGRRPYGYISFAHDVTAHLKPGMNVLAVRVDNSAQPNSRYYSGSGIYRHAWLTLADPLHVAHWGTTVTTPRVEASAATVEVRTIVENRGAAARAGILRATVLDPSGQRVATVETPLAVAAGQSATLAQQLTVPSPRRWSVGTPVLYAVRTEVLVGARTAANGEAGLRRVDSTVTPFGIRTIAFDKDRGFLLNGERLKLNGVNLHHDGGALGAAVPERVWERRLALLKAMGANAIRTSHNPPAPEFLDLCDRMGFVVMAEAFDEWTVAKVPEGYHKHFAEWSERDVVDYVHRDRNHPSIVLWSAGNEIGEQSAPNGADVLRRLLAIFHREDPTRPVTTGNDQIHADGGGATVEFLSALDVVGYNYVDRWRERRELFAEQDRHDHPEWRMIGTESGLIFESRDERYSLGDDPAVVRANYTSGMIPIERRWRWVANHDYFSGDFMWTGVDYLGEATWPFIGFASAPLDIIANPKDLYALYQAQWTRAPVLHLFPHWNWPGREGQMVPVVAYTNCNIVELFLNGRSMGEKRLEFPAQGTAGGWNTYAEPVVNATTSDLHLSWDVPYAPGTLRAVGKKRDGSTCATDEVRTAGALAALRVRADRDSVTTAMGDVLHVHIDVVDATGTIAPTDSTMLTVAVTGGTLLALDNANLRDHTPYQVPSRRAYNGRALAIVRPGAGGTVRVEVSGAGVAPASATIRVVRAVDVPAVPPAR
ncbi:MAG: glycoside hydrolase family 2 protein [Gemmatimonadetes bacterium]|nr:glycoside hydrolase family 2 protein [Gemmatimonadota bacterium]